MSAAPSPVPGKVNNGRQLIIILAPFGPTNLLVLHNLV